MDEKDNSNNSFKSVLTPENVDNFEHLSLQKEFSPREMSSDVLSYSSLETLITIESKESFINKHLEENEKFAEILRLLKKNKTLEYISDFIGIDKYKLK